MKVISYPIDLINMDASTYLWQLEKLFVVGKNKVTSDFLLYTKVNDSRTLDWMQEQPEYKDEVNKKVTLNRNFVKAVFTFTYDDFKNYSVQGTIDKYLNYHSGGTDIKNEFSTGRAPVGYAVAGTVGALAIGFKKSKLPLGTYTISNGDNRSICLNFIQGNSYFLPYNLYESLKELYPEKEEIVFKQL